MHNGNSTGYHNKTVMTVRNHPAVNTPKLTLAYVRDGLRNLVSSVGTSRDKAFNWSYNYVPMTQDELERMYASDWLARKIVDVIPGDMTREWRTWQTDKSEVLYDIEKTFCVRSKVRKALVLARLFGGSAILIGDGSPDPMKPLDLEKIKLGGLKYIHVFSRYELTEGDEITDLEDTDYGKPLWYRINANRVPTANALTIHRSRFAFFSGVDAPSNSLLSITSGWGLPVLEAIRQAIINVNAGASNAAAITEEAKIDVITVPDLMNYVSTKEGTARLTERFAIAAQLKSTVNTLLLGGDEKFERKQISLSGFPELIRTHMEIASAAADVPMTRLMSQSPAGMNATGESDIRNYYDKLRSHQNTDFRETLTPLDEVLIRSALGSRPPDVAYEWMPLWQMTEQERADINQKNALTVQVYVNTGLLDQSELRPAVADMLIESGFLPTLDQHLLNEKDYENLLLEQQQEALLQQQQFLTGPDQTQAAGGQQFLDKDWTEELHPRDPKGTHSGGKFTAKNHATELYEQTVQQEGIPTPEEFFAALSKEDQAAISDALDKTSKAVSTTALVSEGGHKNPDGTYTKERQALHKEILGRLFTKTAVADATPTPGVSPDATFLGGRGGSGKSWLFEGENAPVDKSSAIYINPDDFKAALPEYKGWNAGLLHQESQDLTAQATAMARKLRLSVIHDATMSHPPSMQVQVNEYKELGYEVRGHYMFASPRTAAERSTGRFKRSGRFVPPQYILGSTNNERSFDAVKGEFREWSLWSSNDGFPPKEIASGSKPRKPRTAYERFSTRGGMITSMTVGGRRAI